MGGQSLKDQIVWRAYLAEFVGTFFFQYIGGYSAGIVAEDDWIVPAVLNGLGLTVTVYFAANISGGHLNPAVTLGMTIQGSLSWFDCVIYVICQICGALGGAGLLKWYLDDSISLCGDIDNFGKAYLVELLFTFLLAAIVIACCAPEEIGHGSISPIPIGLVVFVGAGAYGAISGGYFNPARLIGPSAVYGCDDWKIWILLFAQFPAGSIAGLYGIMAYGTGKAFSKGMDEHVPTVDAQVIIKDSEESPISKDSNHTLQI